MTDLKVRFHAGISVKAEIPILMLPGIVISSGAAYRLLTLKTLISIL